MLEVQQQNENASLKKMETRSVGGITPQRANFTPIYGNPKVLEKDRLQTKERNNEISMLEDR